MKYQEVSFLVTFTVGRPFSNVRIKILRFFFRAKLCLTGVNVILYRDEPIAKKRR